MEGPADRQIAVLASRQCGYVTREQLLALGLGTQAIKYRARAGRLITVYAGVYAVGHVPTLPRHRAAAALLACGPLAVLSHASAAALWEVVDRWETWFEVTVSTARRRKGIRTHRTELDGRDIRKHLGLRVTSPARTLLDLAPRMTDRALTRAVNDQLRRGNLRMSQLADLLARAPRAPGAVLLKPLLELPDGNPTRSHLEDEYLAFTKKYGLPEPQVNVWVAGREVDAWYPAERVIVELDSWAFHSDRRSFERDREKDATALRLGIATIRLTRWRMTNAAEAEAERVLAILEARRKLLRHSETGVRPSP